MKLLKKVAVLCIGLLLVLTNSVYAMPSLNEGNSPYSNIQDIINLKEGRTLLIDNTYNHLFWEFKDFDQAIEIISVKERGILSQIQDIGNLEKISKENWKNYSDIFNSEYPDVYDAKNTDKNLFILKEFFTVCENMEINQQALDIYNMPEYDIYELISLLPYTSPVLEKVREKTPVIFGTYYVNINSMVNYAKTYATRHNPNYNYYDNANCTNFASQILRAGGMSTNQVWKPYTGAWNAAHNFVVYWYSRCYSQYSTMSYSSFYNNVKTGDIIACDYQNDGRWDHMGFVASGSGSNFTLAQNSDDYYGTVRTRGWSNAKNFMRLRFPAG